MTHTTKKILIVEDDPLLAMDLEMQLQQRRYEVVGPATCTKSAKTLVTAQEIDFALLDYNLGDETSASIASKLLGAGIPFVYLTGQDASVLKADGAPQAVVFQKPVDLDAIAEHIAKAA